MAARALVVMGVSGSGKSTLGLTLAAKLGWRYVEGDTLHPAANVAKMASGSPLDDADRMPFLAAVAGVIAAARPEGIVVSCSALKRAYRDVIRRAGDVTFVLPLLDRTALQSRLGQRHEHFMPPALLDSQLADFELPAAEEEVIIVDGAVSTDSQVAQVLAGLRN